MNAGPAGAQHATAVLAAGAGLLLRGRSGSGKSMLAAALIERGARLVADDRVYLVPRAGRLIAIAPSSTAGLMELRGAGIVRRPHERFAVIRLIVDLVDPTDLQRMPEPAAATVECAGVTVRGQAVPAPGVSGAVEPALLLIGEAIGRRCHHKSLHLPQVSP